MINRVGNNSYNRIKDKLNMLGFVINPLVFIYMRLISSLILFLVLLFAIPYGYIIAPIVTVLYYIFVEIIIIDLAIKGRIRELEDDAICFMPIFLLAVKSGRNIKKSLQYTTDIIDNTLSKEFKRVLFDEKIGKSFDDALLELKKRIPSDIVVNMIVSIIEANRMGNNVNDSINSQLNYLKDRKNKKILNTYKVVPLKMAIVSVIFVFLVIVLLSVCSF